MKDRKRQNLIGRIFFIVPVVVIISVVSYAFITLNSPGTVSVIAYTHDKYTGSRVNSPVSAPFTITGSTSTYHSPMSFSLRSSSYIVTFQQISGYYTPRSQTVLTSSGRTIFATGVYEAIPRVVQLSSTGFNTSGVSAIHGVTPIVWLNPTSNSIVLNIQPIGRVNVFPGQNYTLVYPNAGTYSFGIVLQNATGSVSVS